MIGPGVPGVGPQSPERETEEVAETQEEEVADTPEVLATQPEEVTEIAPDPEVAAQPILNEESTVKPPEVNEKKVDPINSGIIDKIPQTVAAAAEENAQIGQEGETSAAE